MNDENRLSSRLKRYAKVTTAMSGLAARLAGEKYFGLPLDRENHAEDLKAVLGGLKGPLMKVAQILATVPDILPPEYAAELAELQSNAPPMGWLFVKRRMAAELGPTWQSSFQSFEEEAAAAASLGQVHRAVTKDGQKVACKLQYPDMASVVEADLEQLKVMMSVYESFNKALITTHMHQEIADRLREELDYEREAKHIELYRTMLASYSFIHVPKVFTDLSTKRLLTMEWLEGEKIIKASQGQPLEVRNELARKLFYAWYVPFYKFGIIHGDPHLGNYSVGADHSINLLDFGCIRIFPPSFVKGVIDLYRALKDGDDALAMAAYQSWGFEELTTEIMEILNLWARFLYGPLMEDRVRPLQEGHSGVYGKGVADEVHQRLRAIGGVRPPREFVFMDRAAVGIGSVFMHLNAELNWHHLFEEIIADFDAETLARDQNAVCLQVGLSAFSSTSSL